MFAQAVSQLTNLLQKILLKFAKSFVPTPTVKHAQLRTNVTSVQIKLNSLMDLVLLIAPPLISVCIVESQKSVSTVLRDTLLTKVPINAL